MENTPNDKKKQNQGSNVGREGEVSSERNLPQGGQRPGQQGGQGQPQGGQRSTYPSGGGSQQGGQDQPNINKGQPQQSGSFNKGTSSEEKEEE